MRAAFERKQEIISELHERLAAARCVVAADYAGVDVAGFQQLRKSAAGADVRVKVYKNTLARRSVAGTPYEFIADRLTGQIVIGTTAGDPAALAKVFHEFGKGNESLEVRFGALPQRLLEPPEIERLASIPPREALLALLAGTLQAPAASFARALAAVPSKFARALAAVRDAKDQ